MRRVIGGILGLFVGGFGSILIFMLVFPTRSAVGGPPTNYVEGLVFITVGLPFFAVLGCVVGVILGKKKGGSLGEGPRVEGQRSERRKK